MLVGSWLNVIGTIEDVRTTKAGKEAHVKAVMMWSAGSLDVRRYERALAEMLDQGSAA